MKYIAHDYQRYATEFIETHPVSALFLDLGLGKTVVTLTAACHLLDRNEIDKVLVVAPKRVAEMTWPEEIEKWDHTCGLTWSLIAGSAKKRSIAVNARADIYIISRDNLKWLVEKTDFDFTRCMVVLDELSSFKSWKSQRFRALMSIRPYITHIVGLTGTPSSNGLMDLFAEYKVLDMGKRLGRYITHYRDRYYLPDKRNGEVIFSWKPKQGAEETIYKKISDITISMKAQHRLKMPDIVYNEYPVQMNSKEWKVYEGMKKNMVEELNDQVIDAMNAATLTSKLLQLSSGFVYTDDKFAIPFHEHKLDALEDIIEAANGRPILVAYWFKSDLERIKRRFPDAVDLKKTEDFKRWNNREIVIGLIHPASAGHGLNLQRGSNTIVWYGLTWSLELYQQTNARIYRQGQTDTVIVEHIITKGTIDEDVLDALKNKRQMQDALIHAVKANIGGRKHD